MQLYGGHLDGPVQLKDMLRKGLETKPDEAALVSMEARWTWRGLDEDAERLAGNLLALGLRAGDRVASLMPNRVHLLATTLLACMPGWW